ncbi:RNase H domain-containing protein [Trichonephila clavipes]|nr:RNase H domain-containing protein [Trichonephila clavipes]
MIERQLQTAVNNLVKWCDTNGHSISASKSFCVYFCRKRSLHPDPEIRIRDINIPVVPNVRFPGILSISSHPLKSMSLTISMKSLYDARPSNIRPFMDRMNRLITELDLPNVEIQQRNLLLFQTWNTPRFHYINLFAHYSKFTVAPVVFQRVFAYHRSRYREFSAIYTDGSKRTSYVG